MSTPAERKAAREAAKAERAATRDAAKAEIADLKANLKTNLKAPADASCEELIDILVSTDAEGMKKQSAMARFVQDPSLYKNNKEMIFKKFDDIVKCGGRINYLLDNVIMDRPKLVVPHLKKLIEDISVPKTGGTMLPLIKKMADSLPNDVSPFAKDIVKASIDNLTPAYRGELVNILGIIGGNATAPDAAAMCYEEIIGVMKLDGNGNQVLSNCFEQISNIKEKIPKEKLGAKFPELEQYKSANTAIYVVIEDFIADRSLQKVTARVDDHEARLNAHEAWLKEQESKLNTLAANFELSQEKMLEMTEEINNIAGSDEQTASMLAMLDQINEVMQSQDNGALQEAQLEGVLDSDPYLRAFYNSFRSELSATYLAAKSVQTDIVTNSKTGAAGSVGSVLQTASSYIPVIGAGVMFFGAVLSMVDQNQQAAMVKRYADLAVDTDEFGRISRTLAGELVKSLDRSKINKPDSIMDRCKGLISAGVELASGNLGEGGSLGEVVGSTISNIATSTAQESAAGAIESTDFSKFFTSKGKKEVDPKAAAKAQGQADAGVVANTIISFIYAGKVDAESTKGKIECLVSFAMDEFCKEGAVKNNLSAGPSSTGSTGKSVELGKEIVAKPYVPPVTPKHSEHDKWASFLTDGENIVATSLLNKPNQMGFQHKRQLILTDAPRLFYIDVKSNEVKGTVEWTSAEPPTVKIVRCQLFANFFLCFLFFNTIFLFCIYRETTKILNLWWPQEVTNSRKFRILQHFGKHMWKTLSPNLLGKQLRRKSGMKLKPSALLNITRLSVKLEKLQSPRVVVERLLLAVLMVPVVQLLLLTHLKVVAPFLSRE